MLRYLTEKYRKPLTNLAKNVTPTSLVARKFFLALTSILISTKRLLIRLKPKHAAAHAATVRLLKVAC